MDNNRDEVSDVEDAEDPMDVLKCCEDSIWEASPFRNPRHCEKIRQVAHNQTLEGLGLLGKKAEPASSDYKAMYICVFKAVVAKQAALNKSDSQPSMPSIGNIEDYMEQGHNQTQLEPKMEVEAPFVDPLVENAIAQINALQQHGEPDDTYHRHCEAAVRLHHVMFERTQACLDPNQACHFEETDSAIPTMHEASEASRHGIQVPFHAHMPIANNRQDCIAYQHLRNEDLERQGSSLYDDQGILFDGH